MSEHGLDAARPRTAGLRHEAAALAMPDAFRLVGYDKGSDRRAVEHAVPHRHAAAARNIAGLREADDAERDAWRLGPSQAQYMGRLLHQPVDTRRFDYVLLPGRRTLSD